MFWIYSLQAGSLTRDFSRVNGYLTKLGGHLLLQFGGWMWFHPTIMGFGSPVGGEASRVVPMIAKPSNRETRIIA